ncbi:hypothetical protein EVAR_97427_1 [Eumeta japonica]|uniref:Uncharacterized protein n=1 Tax=Eumeta variegata TaxID=151549 RepID=A0A4C1WWT6_EUMVA|nr:hypothetical protein EVAR_97427_1 [Eumeta japonica]
MRPEENNFGSNFIAFVRVCGGIVPLNRRARVLAALYLYPIVYAYHENIPLRRQWSASEGVVQIELSITPRARGGPRSSRKWDADRSATPQKNTRFEAPAGKTVAERSRVCEPVPRGSGARAAATTLVIRVR